MTEETTIECSEKMRINEMTNLHQELTEALEKYGVINFDLNKTTEIDTACLQMLLAFKDVAGSIGIEVKLQSVPEIVPAQAKLLGLYEQLGLE